MRRSLTIALCAAVLSGCAQPADPGDDGVSATEEARRELLESVARALESPESLPCEGCGEHTPIELLPLDLNDPLSIMRQTVGSSGAGTVHLTHPARFWTMTFGADGGLLGISVTPGLGLLPPGM